MKFTAVIAILIALLIGVPSGLKIAEKVVQDQKITTITEKVYNTVNLPAPEDVLSQEKPVNPVPVQKVMTLEENNVVVFKGPVTEQSVSKAMKELRDKSRKLSKSQELYLVLDTPGGSVFDGLDFIDFAEALPQKVNTITLFAASMGFQFVQNLNTRYVQRNGTLMSHRAYLGGCEGQLDGEFESCYKMVKRKTDYLDYIAAKRMGLSIEDYKNLIVNEYWVHGFDAVGDNAADEQVLLTCGSSLDGSEIVEFRTFFGLVKVTFAKCPLIRAPEKVEFPKFEVPSEEQKQAQESIMDAFYNQKKFVRDVIQTNRFHKIFPRR